MKTNKRRLGILLAFLAGTLCVASVGRADDKDLLKGGSARPNVMVILSNTSSMQYLPYLQGTTPNVPPDGQYQDSPVSKFALAKGAFRAIVTQNSNKFNFGLSWYSYHQEGVSRKYWSYQFTSNATIAGAGFDFPGTTFKSAVGTYYELGTGRQGPDFDSRQHGNIRHRWHDSRGVLVRRYARGRTSCTATDLYRLRHGKHRQ